MRSVSVIISIVLSILGTISSNEIYEIAPGATFKSPDSNYIAKTVGGGLIPATDRIVILNANTGVEEVSVDVKPPVYSLVWTGDSKNVVAVSHIAGGTVAGIIHHSADGWKQYSADPREGDKYKVIRLTVQHDTLELTYKIMTAHSDNSSPSFYLYTFVFDPKTTAHLREKRHAIDGETYSRLKPEAATVEGRD
jgi:hypothetical protein